MTTRRVTIVVATRDRCAVLLDSLQRLSSLGLPIIVVDNGSRDGSVDAVRGIHPSIRVVSLAHNVGGAARNIGVNLATTPYVAFADDDSWWAPASLCAARAVLDAHRRLGLVAARVLVGDDAALDPLSRLMARSPLGPAFEPDTRKILGFAACAAVVRRDAFTEVGGFMPRFMIGGEEEIVALDLRTAGWELAYVPDVVAHHHPGRRSNDARAQRRRRLARNTLWTAWLRYPPRLAVATTRATVTRGRTDRATMRGVADALSGVSWAARSRRPVPSSVRSELALLRATGDGTLA